MNVRRSGRLWPERILETVRAHEPISCAELKRRLGAEAKGRERFAVIGRVRWTGLSYEFGDALYGLILLKKLWVDERYPCRISIRRDGQ